MIQQKSFDFDHQKNKNIFVSERDDSSIIERIDIFRNKLRYYRNYGDAIFIRVILIGCSSFYIAQWSCFMRQTSYLLAILLNLIIVIDGIYVLVYRKVNIILLKK